MLPRLLSLAVLTAAVCGYTHDLLLPQHTPADPSCTCAEWTTKPEAVDWFTLEAELVSAGSSCAMPGLAIMPPDSSLAEYGKALSGSDFTIDNGLISRTH